MLVVALLGVVAAIGTWSAFSSTTENPGNTFSAGSVSLTDNDSGTAMFTMTNMVPGSTEAGCIKVIYTGTLTSNVSLYGTTTGTGLDPFLNLKITRGTYSSDPGFDSCTNFSADATNYIAAGAGVIFNGTLQGYPDSFAAGLVDPTSGSPEAWTNPENHVYKFEITLQDNNLAQGLNATQAFTWEARNV
jgi:predicted ribosomally synthesized peptide with SipW-like signal peptide